ncbi:MAG: transcription-repair coupling factor, partial [Desulfuromusa sp.]|nr:transcription-repair coupling factor [Desulfuromusa sp.]
MNDETQQNIRNATIHSFIGGVTANQQTVEVLGLHGSADAYLLAQLLEASSEQRIILCAELETARQLVAELKFLYPQPDKIALLPHWELNPYDPLTPHPELEAIRMTTLAALNQGQVKALILPVRSLMQKVIPRQVLESVSLQLLLEEEYERKQLLNSLTQLGYQPVPLVEERGSFAVRGDIIDLFPPDAEQPIRLDFYGDFIEKMRTFDPASQRSGDATLKSLTLIPAKEMILHGPFLKTLGQKLKERCDELAIPRTDREAIMTELREGILSPGRAFLLPFNYPELDPVEQYLDNPRLVIIDPPAIEQEIDLFHRDIRDGEARMQEQKIPHARRQALYLEPDQLKLLLHNPLRVEISRLQVIQFEDERQRYHFNCQGNGSLRTKPDSDHAGLEPLLQRLQQTKNESGKTLLVCHQRSQAERLQELLAAHGVELEIEPNQYLSALAAGGVTLTIGELNRGFYLPNEKLNIISEEEIFGRRSHRQKKTGRQRARQLMTSLAELKKGDFIVHTDHGIGCYLGLTHLQTGTIEGDFLNLEYAGNDKLYLPIERIEKVQKYLGGEGYSPKLDKMGGQGWQKAHLKARAAVEELARQLLELYAKRELRQGFAYSPPDQLYREFEATFPYEETIDQQQAIDDILDDMQSAKPMDRLICGDVGYGKTEVALRAAVKA